MNKSDISRILMKAPITLAIFFVISAISLSLPFHGYCQNTAALMVQIEGIENSDGYMMVAVYDKAALFLSDSMLTGKKYKVKHTGTMYVSVELSFGEYGISVFHDLDANGDLDTNFFGIPTEPIGFSNNAKITFGPPKFDSVKFPFTQDQQKISIILR